MARYRKVPTNEIKVESDEEVQDCREKVVTVWSSMAWATLITSTITILCVLLLVLKGTIITPHFNDRSIRDRFHLSPEDHQHRDVRTVYYDWIVEKHRLSPDGVEKLVYAINGMFPGPTIEARPGDTIIINVINAMNEETSLHWHGLRQFNQNAMDGAVGITQCGIAPGNNFTYTLCLDPEQSGTFWYHSHSHVQRTDGLYGAFVIHDPKDPSRYDYEKEVVLMLGDWFHKSAEDMLAYYFNRRSMGFEPVPDSSLVNGQNSFNCTNNGYPIACQETQRHNIQLNPTVRYRLRLINVGSLADFTIAIDQHRMQIIEVEGSYTKRQVVDAIPIGPGQRYSVVLLPTTATANKRFTLRAAMNEKCFNYPNDKLDPEIKADLVYSDGEESERLTRLGSIRTLNPYLLEPLHPVEIPKADVFHLLYALSMRLDRNQQSPWGYFNRTSWRPASKPLLQSPVANSFDANQLIISTEPEKDIVIELVINNGDESSHSFHIHGHAFWVTHVYESQIGWGQYDPSSMPHPPISYPNSILRDTVMVPRRGYAVLRMRMDNPGFWAFHCHVMVHQATGMLMTFRVKQGNIAPEQMSIVASTCL